MRSRVEAASWNGPISTGISLLVSALAGGALLAMPIPGWGWAALRAFLQF
jgi:hypothetical protein